MKIHKLTLPTTHIDLQEEIYRDRLGFSCRRPSETHLQIQCGASELNFVSSRHQFYYHYCFLVPPGCLPAAMKLLDECDFEPLPFHGERLVDFSNGKSIYFYDGDHNIGEFIQRPSLGHPAQTSFTSEDVICLNEIGIPVTHPKTTASRMIDAYAIELIENAPFRDDFIWCGDFEGVFLITEIGRPWMPCSKPAESNPLSVTFETKAGIFEHSESVAVD